MHALKMSRSNHKYGLRPTHFSVAVPSRPKKPATLFSINLGPIRAHQRPRKDLFCGPGFRAIRIRPIRRLTAASLIYFVSTEGFQRLLVKLCESHAKKRRSVGNRRPAGKFKPCAQDEFAVTADVGSAAAASISTLSPCNLQ